MNPHAFIKDPEQIRTIESIKRVDDEGYLIVDDANNVVVGIDYLTTNESFEIN